MSPNPTFNKVVLSEMGFTVEFSNQGNKLMFNPNPQNLEKRRVPCFICGRMTNTIYGLCTKHNQKNKKKGYKDCRKEIKHIADWFARLIPPGYRRNQVLVEIMPHPQITEILIKWMKKNKKREKIMDNFVKDVLESIVGNVPDATYLQKSLRGEITDITTPDNLVEMTKQLVNKHFPKKDYSKVRLDGGTFKGKSLANIPIRIVATLLILAWACEESNRGDAWFCKINKRESKYGNAYMPSVYYFLRRYTKATAKQARICLKG